MSRTPLVTGNEPAQAPKHYLDFSDMRAGQLVANAPIRELMKLSHVEAKARFQQSLGVGLQGQTILIGRASRQLQTSPAERWPQHLVARAVAVVTDIPRAIKRVPRRVDSRGEGLFAGVQGETAVRMLFDCLADYWINETRFTSSFMAIAQHPAAELLVRLGKPIVPLLVERLDDDPDRFGYILARITEAQPVSEGADPSEVGPVWRTWLDDHNWT